MVVVYCNTLIHFMQTSLYLQYSMLVGHGPFSHMFDGKFIPAARPDYKWKVVWAFLLHQDYFTST